MVILPISVVSQKNEPVFSIDVPSADSKMSPVTLSFENLNLLDCGPI